MRLPKAVAGINIDGLELIKARKRQSLADWVKTSPSTRRGSGPIVLRVEAIRCRKIPTNKFPAICDRLIRAVVHARETLKGFVSASSAKR